MLRLRRIINIFTEEYGVTWFVFNSDKLWRDNFGGLHCHSKSFHLNTEAIPSNANAIRKWLKKKCIETIWQFTFQQNVMSSSKQYNLFTFNFEPYRAISTFANTYYEHIRYIVYSICHLFPGKTHRFSDAITVHCSGWEICSFLTILLECILNIFAVEKRVDALSCFGHQSLRKA